MMFEEETENKRSSNLPQISRYSEQRIREVIQTKAFLPGLLDSYGFNLSSDRQITSKSLKLKSQRSHELRFLSERDRKTINSLSKSFQKGLNCEKSESQDKFSHPKQMKTFSKESTTKQYFTKNSLMSKILFQHKKTNKMHFEDSRSELFNNFHKSSIYLNQNITETKQLQDSPNDKIVALLNDSPLKKISPLKCNVRKLKMIYNLKALAKKNVPFNSVFNRKQFEEEGGQSKRQTESKSFTSNLKSNQSLKFAEKPFVRTELLKGGAKSFNKLQRFSSIQKDQKHNRRKSLLMISDEDGSDKNLQTITSEVSERSIQTNENSRTQSNNKSLNSKKNNSFKKETSHDDKQSRQVRCQERILNDLVKLEQMRNKQFYAENKVLRKSTRVFAQSMNQVKLLPKDKDKLKSHKIKYLVKFKTEPKQNQQSKLEAKLSRMIPEIEALRRKIWEETKFEGEKVSGVAHPLNERGAEFGEKNVKGPCSLRRTQTRSFEDSFGDKQLSGWDFQNQIEEKDNWNLRL